MKHSLLTVIAAIIAAMALPSHSQQSPPGADPALVALLGKHSKALENSFTVSIHAEIGERKTKKEGKFYRGRTAGGWASRQDTLVPSIISTGKAYKETIIDRPGCRLELFELNMTGIKANYSDPHMPRSSSLMMRPPMLESDYMLSRYQLDGKSAMDILPPSRSVLVATERHFDAVSKVSNKDHMKFFVHRMEITWLPDRYLIRSIKQLNKDGGVIASCEYSDYHFDELPNEFFSDPAAFTLTEVLNRTTHAAEITKSRTALGVADLVKGGVSTNLIAAAQAKAKANATKPDKLKISPKITFIVVFAGLVSAGLAIVFTLRLKRHSVNVAKTGN